MGRPTVKATSAAISNHICLVHSCPTELAELLKQVLRPEIKLHLLSADSAATFPVTPGAIWLVESDYSEHAILCRQLRQRPDRPRVLLIGNHRYPNKAVKDPFEIPVPYVGTSLLPLWLTNLIPA